MTDMQELTRRAGPSARPMVIGMVVFDDFELLDVFGPLEMFGMLGDRIHIVILAEMLGTAKSSGGPAIVVDHTFADVPQLDLIIVPGGMGTRRQVDNDFFISALRRVSECTPHVASVCTGSAVLARTGLLDGRQATTNKLSYQWATSQGPDVRWVRQARWVEDGKYFTSSGVSAGIDMSLALIERLFGESVATQVAYGAEYEWNQDPHHDPFAKANY